MDEELIGKDRFDALHKLADHAWREWDHKARYQWRLAFAIWGALLAAISVAITQPFHSPPWLSQLICSLLVVIHWFFLGWIEGRIRECRRQLYQYMLPMESLTKVESDALKKFVAIMKKEDGLHQLMKKAHRWGYRVFVFWRKPAAAVHLAITILLAGVLLHVTLFGHSAPSGMPS